jgi:nitrate/nitrite transporter NarK
LPDVTYEGARSINGPFLVTLSASAAVVGIVSGAGELIGYVLRLAGGAAADKTRRYWTLTMVGYVINLLVVRSWQPRITGESRWFSSSPSALERA